MVGAATLMTLWASGVAAQRSLIAPAGRAGPGQRNALPTPDSHTVQNCVPECEKAETVASESEQSTDGEDDCDEDADGAPLDSRAQYVHDIQAQIHRRCRYPRDRANARGVAVVSFAVSGAGKLMEACVSRSSGNRELDLIALESVRGAGLFPPTPTGGDMRFSAPFQFR